ncbi:hypothetical protein ACQUJO_21485 [Ralstonia pseudosolanacearum]
MYELTSRQRFWAIRAAGMLCAALSLQSCASADDETAGGIAAAKAKQLEAARQQARAPFSAGEIATREVLPTTLRDSGQPDAIGYLRHVDFRFDGGASWSTSWRCAWSRAGRAIRSGSTTCRPTRCSLSAARCA